MRANTLIYKMKKIERGRNLLRFKLGMMKGFNKSALPLTNRAKLTSVDYGATLANG